MAAIATTLTRTLVLLVFGAWGWALVYTGFWLVLLGHRSYDISPGAARAGGTALAAAGVFVFAFAASRCFPLASRRVTLAAEIAPWAAALAVLALGGWA